MSLSPVSQCVQCFTLTMMRACPRCGEATRPYTMPPREAHPSLRLGDVRDPTGLASTYMASAQTSFANESTSTRLGLSPVAKAANTDSSHLVLSPHLDVSPQTHKRFFPQRAVTDGSAKAESLETRRPEPAPTQSVGDPARALPSHGMSATTGATEYSSWSSGGRPREQLRLGVDPMEHLRQQLDQAHRENEQLTSQIQLMDEQKRFGTQKIKELVDENGRLVTAIQNLHVRLQLAEIEQAALQDENQRLRSDIAETRQGLNEDRPRRADSRSAAAAAAVEERVDGSERESHRSASVVRELEDVKSTFVAAREQYEATIAQLEASLGGALELLKATAHMLGEGTSIRDVPQNVADLLLQVRQQPSRRASVVDEAVPAPAGRLSPRRLGPDEDLFRQALRSKEEAAAPSASLNSSECPPDSGTARSPNAAVAAPGQTHHQLVPRASQSDEAAVAHAPDGASMYLFAVHRRRLLSELERQRTENAQLVGTLQKLQQIF